MFWRQTFCLMKLDSGGFVTRQQGNYPPGSKQKRSGRVYFVLLQVVRQKVHHVNFLFIQTQIMLLLELLLELLHSCCWS